MPRVFVAAGSNVEPERHLALAFDALERAFPGTRISPAYRNRAVGFTGADFINAVAAFDTDLPLGAVLERLHAIEAACGRPRDAPKWAPRSMDLDVLLYGDLVSEASRVPRPDLLQRAYMLGPLADLAPELVHPTAGETIGALWSRYDREGHPLERVTIPRCGRRPPRAPDP